MERVTDEWDQIIESSKTNQPNTKKPSQTCPLRIFQQNHRVTFSPKKVRSMAQVPEPLREMFRKLCRGEIAWPLLISGPTGTGKTCAALALVDFIPKGEFLTEAGLIEALNHRRENGDLPATWKQIENASLFVLDEFGLKNTPTQYNCETILRLLDTRIARPTIITINSTCDNAGDLLDEVSRLYDDRIASRLSAGTVFFLKGDDRRLTNR